MKPICVYIDIYKAPEFLGRKEGGWKGRWGS